MRRFRYALVHRVAASIEHAEVISALKPKLVIDIGANRGQFALAARQFAPMANVVSFEPLAEPALVFERIFRGDSSVELYRSAIGPVKEQRNMHVSAKDDSSSLLPISSLQGEIFPGTEAACIAKV